MPKIAVLSEPKHIEIQNRGSLKPGSQEVIVSVETAGICGTDLAIFSGDYKVKLPLVLGHEFVGKVTATGKGVASEWMDRRVTAEINNTCIAYKAESLCRPCYIGLSNHCQKRTVTGIIGHHGAFAEEIAIPAGALHKIPDTLDPQVAVLTEPLAAALQTFELISDKRPGTVAVLGPGKLGILIVFVAVLRGHHVIAVTRSGLKRKRALNFGAKEVFSPEEAESGIKNLTEGMGVDIVVDTTGHPDGINQALKIIRPRGTIAIKTTCGLNKKGIDMTKMVVDEIRIQGSRCGPFAPAIELLQIYPDQFRKLITTVRSLDEAQSAIESAYDQPKIIFQMQG